MCWRYCQQAAVNRFGVLVAEALDHHEEHADLLGDADRAGLGQLVDA